MSAGAVREVAWSAAAKPAWRWATTSRAAASTSRSSKPATGRAEAWLGRWDSLRLFTPARRDALPGRPFPGDPDRYPDARRGRRLPDRLRRRAAGRATAAGCARCAATARASGSSWTTALVEARQVVVATGPFQVPRMPALASGLAPEVRALHSSAYRRPADLPDGPVLVVGGGNTGFQIAEELVATREVHLAIGSRQTPMPQRMLGRDLFDWLVALRRPCA